MVSFLPASGSSYTASAGDVHTGEVRGSSLYGAYLYVNDEYVKWVWGSETAKSLLLSYTYPSDAVGSYKMGAYVYPWNGNTYGDYTYYSYTVSVSGSVSVPGVPVLSAVGGNGSVDLSWVAPEDGGSAITHYEYRYGVGASVEESDYGSWTSTGSTDTSHTVSSLTNGSYHLFEVRAVNAIGNGAASIASGVTPVAPSAPDDGGSVITGYQYKYCKYDNGWHNWTSLSSTGSTSTSYTVSGLESGGVYRFRVVAVNSVGSSSSSKAAQTTAP